MEEKKKIKISLSTFFLILAIITIIVMGLFIYKLNYNKTKAIQKSSELQSQVNSLNNIVNDLQGKINTISNTINADNNQNKEENNNDATTTKENINSQKNEYNIAVDNIKKYLKDEIWLKNNVYIQNDENNNNSDISDQVIGFFVCKDTVRPSIIINVSSENARYIKTILVTYINNNIKVEKISQGHIYHGGCSVDSNKNIIHTLYMHMGSDEEWVYKVKNGEIEFIGGYGKYDDHGDKEKYHIKEIKEKYENYKKNLNTKQYDSSSFLTATTSNKDVTKEEYEKIKNNLNIKQYKSDTPIPLTNSNIDEYIK